MAEIKLYGIRHHGAGSCRNLLTALRAHPPDIVLVECPSDAESLIRFIALDLLVPPVALMIYNPTNLNQYVYYPFTIFSPEWQAIKFGIDRDIPIWFFDLPQSQSFLISDSKTITRKEKGFNKDPFGYMARLADFDDPERWWEEFIEQQRTASDIFDTILDLMIELRQSETDDKQSNLLREAFMRGKIRKAINDGYEKIAVVCGAWHTPMLVDIKKYKVGDDKKLLTGLKKTKVTCTWVPWSYNRIAQHAGYESGVLSPYWYEALFTDPENAVARWMTRASRLLQELGHPVSPAHTIEASVLAEHLATMRKKNVPGISELFDAVVAVHTQGQDDILDQLKQKLLEGEKTGSVSEEVPTVPLLKDLEFQLKKTTLHRAWKKEGEIEKHFDLRKPRHLEGSRLLHKMQLLGIDWGEQEDVQHTPLGTFHEYWNLEWFPEFEMQIIEASMWGNTVDEAANQFVQYQLAEDKSFDALGLLLYQALHSYLPTLIEPISKKIRDLGNLTEDVFSLVKIMPPLVWSLRYGDISKIDTHGVMTLIDQLFPRICILLPDQVINLPEEIASNNYQAIREMQQALQLFDDFQWRDMWNNTLLQITNLTKANALIKGGTLRILVVQEQITEDELYRTVRFNLSNLDDPFYPCNFLEGLLQDGGWLLIHKPNLRALIDRWLLDQEQEQFMAFLPILRRTFSTFNSQEKESLFQLLFAGRFVEEQKVVINTQRKELIETAIRRLLE